MTDEAKQGFSMLLTMMGVVFALLGIGMVFGVMLSDQPFASVGGKVAATVFALGAVFVCFGTTIAPKKAVDK